MIFTPAAQAGQSHHFAPFALISRAWAAIAFAFSAPKIRAAEGDSKKGMV